MNYNLYITFSRLPPIHGYGMEIVAVERPQSSENHGPPSVIATAGLFIYFYPVVSRERAVMGPCSNSKFPVDNDIAIDHL